MLQATQLMVDKFLLLESYSQDAGRCAGGWKDILVILSCHIK